MKPLSISIFLPAYNEEQNIEEAISKIVAYLEIKKADYELIVINDGSTDMTPIIVKRMQKDNPRIKFVDHKHNQGYGVAMLSGISAANKDYIFYTDADNQFDINDLDKLLPLIKNNDIVAGYRSKRQDPPMRIFIAFVYNLLIRFCFGLKVKDIDCAFKIYKREVFSNLKLSSKTGLMDAEILIKAQQQNMKIAQVAVSHYPRIKGKTMYETSGRNRIFTFVRPSVIIDILKEIKKLWPELK